MLSVKEEELVSITTNGDSADTYTNTTSEEPLNGYNRKPSVADERKASQWPMYGVIVLLLIIFVGLVVWISFLTAEVTELKSTQAESMKYSPIIVGTSSPTIIPTMIPTEISTVIPTANPSMYIHTTANPTIPFCQDEDYFKQTLKEEYSQSIGSIIKNEDIEEYEASGVAYDASRDVYWVVFDNDHSIGKLTSDLTRNEDNILVSSPTKIKLNGDDDGYESITWDAETDILYLLTEAVGFDDDNDDTTYFPVIRSIVYDEESSFIQTQICAVDLAVPKVNKGLEGLDIITIDGAKYFVALCEGNYCSYSDEGKDSGNGRMVLISFSANTITMDHEYGYLLNEEVDCMYNVINMLTLPSYIDFIDYSDFEFRINNDSDVDNEYDMAILSQESASMWIGKVQWSLDSANFSDDYDDETYRFPMGADCETVFCNVEGIAFANDYEFEFVMVSDKVKRGGDQSWVCGDKDESIHIFKLP